ncbi:MAG: beta-phosphoglucomutase [Clostridiales bacterium]|jgi:beta-phosphoglucomutase|nr:beta-phosphoglucomutase [Clostridiales bacterium]
MFKMAVFDLDGVLTDTAKYHYLAWKELADELGFEFTHAHNERLKGVSRMRSLEILLEVGSFESKFTEEEKAQMAEDKNNRYAEYIKQLTPDDLLPGAEKTLKELKERGVLIGLGSASKNAPEILTRLGITNWFNVITDGTKTQKPKPDPEVFTLCADTMGIEREKCVVFEDAQAGVDAARAAGMAVVGVGKAENLSGVDMLISGLNEFDADVFF